MGAWVHALMGSRAVLGPGEQISFPCPPFSSQLWYFWRRRLFIWISFMDSYFEILLYVGPHPFLFISGLGEACVAVVTRQALEG